MRNWPLLRRRPITPVAPHPGRRVADVVAPDAVTAATDHVQIDGTYARTVALTAYPRSVSWGWLHRIAARSAPLLLSVHITPQDSSQAIRQYMTQLTMLESSRLFAAQRGRLANAERQQAIADKQAMVQWLERGDERLFETSVYATVQAPTLPALDERTRRVEDAFSRSQMQTRRVLFESLGALESTLPRGTDPPGFTTSLPGAILATMYPFGAPTLRMPDGIWYGRNVQNNTLVVVDPFHRGFRNYNSCIIGTSGAGKSTAAKVEILRGLGRGIQYVVIDPGESGEYVRLAHAVGGQVVRLSAGSRDHINPLDLPQVTDTDGQEPYDVLAEHISDVLVLLEVLLGGEHGRLESLEKARLESALLSCYAAAGLTADPATHGCPAPTLPDLLATLRRMEGTGDLAARLARYCTGALSGLFSGQTTVSLTAPLTVFDLRGLGNDDLRAAVMHLVTQYVWRLVQSERRPRALVVDEAHMVTRRKATGDFLEGLTRRARKCWFRVTALTQDPTDFLATDAGRALLLNSSMALLLSSDKLAMDAIAAWETLSPTERDYLLRCARGQGLLLVQHPYAAGARLRIQVEIMVSPEQEDLVFTNPAAEAHAPHVEPAASGRSGHVSPDVAG